MRAKKRLLCASALCGSLFAISQPAWADCTTQEDAVRCKGVVTGGVSLPAGTQSLTNLGTILGTADAPAVRGDAVEITNTADGVIGDADAPGIAVSGNDNVIVNAGSIYGDIVGGGQVWNGMTTDHMPVFGPGRLDGDILFGDGDDLVANAGLINGDISLGLGFDTLINHSAGVINGTIDLGSAEDGEGQPPAGEGRPANTLSNGGVINGDILGGEGNDEIDHWGAINGDIDLKGGDDVLIVSGSIDGNVLLGGGDDLVIIHDRPFLGDERRVDAEGGNEDHLVFSGDNGTWKAGQFGNFERLTKTGGGRAVLTDTWWGFAEVEVWDGILETAAGPDDGLGGTLTASGPGIYLLNGVHYGDIWLKEGGVLAGNGRNDPMGLGEVHVYNESGVVSPGEDGIGTLTFSNDYHQGALGRLDIELGAPGVSDLLIVGGTAYLDGAVRFIPLDLADTGPYVFMHYNAVTGQFAAIEGSPGAPGLFYTYNVAYQANQAVVNVVKTGTPDDPEEPEPPAACTPSPAPSGATVICVPPVSTPQDFTTHDLDIRVNGVLSLADGSHVIRTSGSDNLLTVAADGGLINTGEGAALLMDGEAAHLVNHGHIRSEAEGRQRHIRLNAAIGKTSVLENRAGGVIGVEGDTDAIAVEGGLGALNVVNDGRIHGDIVAGGERLHLTNGRVGDNGDLMGDHLIQGDILGSAAADEILNRGRIEGDLRTYAGADLISNLGGEITGAIDMGAGDDRLVADGLNIGDIAMGEGADLLELRGRIDGDVAMGAGDDRVWIDRLRQPGDPAAFDADHVMDGGEGVDALVFHNDNGVWDAGQFANFETLRKEGAGTTTLTGVWDHFGPESQAEIAGGALRLADDAEMHLAAVVSNGGHYQLDGVQLADVVVEAGGLLSGNGAVGSADLFAAGDAFTLTNHGVVAPGGSVGTLTIRGDYHQGETGRLDIELRADGESDRLDVRGQALLDGAVQFVPLDAGIEGDYTFLTAAGGVSGEFSALNPDADLAQQGIFFSYGLDYSTPGQVSVSVTRTGDPGDPGDPTDPEEPEEPEEPGDPDPQEPDLLDVIAGLTGNQDAVRDAFMAGGAFTSDLAGVRASLNAIKPSLAAAALDSYSGEIYAASPWAAGRSSKRFAGAIGERFAGERLETQDPSGSGLVVWGQILAENGEQEGGREYAGYDMDLIGAVAGADVQVRPGLRVGAALGRTDADVDQARLGATVGLRSNHLAVYAAATAGPAFAEAQVSFGRHELDARRTLIVSETATRTARGETEASSVHASVTAGYRIEALQARWRPWGGLNFSRVEQDAFVETGAGDAGLEVGATEWEATTAAIGVDAAWTAGPLRPYAGVSLSRDLSEDGWRASSRLIGGSAGATLTVRGAEPGATAVSGRFGMGGMVGPVEFNAGYDVEARDRYVAHAVTAGLRLRW